MKNAIVTGGSRGIGAAIVKMLAENGYNVVLNYNKSFDEAMKIKNEFDNVEFFKADVSNFDEDVNLVNFAISRFGNVDLLVNNAGCDIFRHNSRYFDRRFRQNFKN